MRIPELFQKLNFEDVWEAYWNHESDITIYRLKPGAKDYLHDNLSKAWDQLIATTGRPAKAWERLTVRRRISVNGEVRYEGLSWDWQKNDFGCLQANDWELICGTEIMPCCIEAYGEINVAAALLHYITQYSFSPEQTRERLDEIVAALEVGEADIREGRTVPFEDVMNRLYDKLGIEPGGERAERRAAARSEQHAALEAEELEWQRILAQDQEWYCQTNGQG